MNSSKIGGDGFPVLLAAGLALVPKCPLCCGAYLSFLSLFGIVNFPYADWFLPGIASLLLLNLLLLGLNAVKSHLWGPLTLSILGTGSLISGRFWLGGGILCWTGVTLVILASTWNLLARNAACPSHQRNSVKINQ